MKIIDRYVEDRFRNTELESKFDGLLSGEDFINIMTKFVELTKNEVLISIEVEASHNSAARYECSVFNTVDNKIKTKSGYLTKEHE